MPEVLAPMETASFFAFPLFSTNKKYFSIAKKIEWTAGTNLLKTEISMLLNLLFDFFVNRS